ncbi:hypothetical protein [Nocardia salmonicida]|uniref:hypothetical protein n=1 Tax=Nocardia salmonicida TaxID=53431 RepID=UPI0034105472
MLTTIDETHMTWKLAPIIFTATVLTPVALLTLLISLTALVAMFGSNRRSERAMRIFDATLAALMTLVDALLRTGHGGRSRRTGRNTRGSRR